MIVIAVCGGTGSGKSYLSKKIINQFNKYKVEYLCLDSYYKNYKDLSFAERCEINFDHPNSIDFELFYQHLKSLIDGNEIYCPVYSYKSHKRLSKNKKITPDKIEIKKFDPVVRKHVLYKESKIK